MVRHRLFLLLFVFSPLAWTQGPKISFDASQYSVSESDSSIEVCATVNEGSLSSNVIVTIATLPATATDPDDYTSLSQPHTFTTGGPTRRCSTIQIIVDDTVESPETFSVGLSSVTDILDTPTVAIIGITDSSELTLSLSSAEYFVSEGIIVIICVNIVAGETEITVHYTITTGGGSASAGGDYANDEFSGSFGTGASPGDEKCFILRTFSDRNVENNETFLVELTGDNSAAVTNGVAIVNILDNDNVEVSWKETAVTVDEGNNGAVVGIDICLVLDSVSGGLQRPARFRLTSIAGTADGNDYVPLVDVILEFTSSHGLGDSVCQTVSIIGDDIMEGDETLTVVATSLNNVDMINNLDTVHITILDGADNQLACPLLDDPSNGVVEVNGVTPGSTSTYTCNIGYMISGAASRTCGSGGVWQEPEPSCQLIDCGPPPSPMNANPSVNVTATIFGVQITYVCSAGHTPDGDTTIRCGNNGRWSGPGPQCNPVQCGELNNPPNGVVSVTQTVYPGSATYSCNTGYSLSGGNTRNCQTNAMWSGTAPVCTVVSCPLLVNPPNGNVQHPQGREYLSTARYTCESGYTRSSGNNERTCQASGLWNGSELVCSPVDCGLLPQLENGDIRYSGTEFDETAEFSCLTGYELSHTFSRRCQADTSWSGTSPTCILVGCGLLDDPSNGQVTVTDFTFDSVARYSCTAGCPPAGLSSRVCQSDGTWTGSTPSCPVINCGTLSNPTNGVVQFLSGSTAGGEVKYQCNAGYNVVGPITRVCQCSGEWSGAEPICQAVDCGTLDDPLNGVVSIPETDFMSTATYTCNTGYNLVGYNMRSCLANETWSNSTPICEIVTCPPLSNVPNGEVSFAVAEFGSMATYSCWLGYRLEGDSERECLATGMWSGNPPNCQVVRCPLLDNPDNGQITLYTNQTFNNSLVVYSCDSTFDLIGSDRRTCQESGEWSGQPPQCIEIACGELPSPMNGNVVVEGNGLGAVATYSCETGYNREGGMTRVCQNAASPTWSNSAPTCNIVMCPTLPNPTNGAVEYNPGTSYQSEARFSCDNGYQLNDDSSLICEASGAWSGSSPVCEIVVCSDLIAPEESSIQYSSRPLEYQTRAQYVCASGHTLDGSGIRVCEGDGTWNGTSPRCRPVDCEALTDPPNGTVEFARTTFGSIALYDCNENFMSSGSDTRICQADRLWSGFPPTCRLVDCGNPPFVFFSTSDTTATTVGTVISYTCFSGRRLVGERQRTCLSNGEWSGETPECVEIICENLDSPLNGGVIITSNRLNGVATYECEVGHRIDGEETRTCVGEGVWSGSAPLCRIVTCPSLSSPSKGQVETRSLQYQSTATYSCIEGYNLVGERIRSCLTSGNWSGQDPQCTPLDCGPLSSPPNGIVSIPNTELGAQATYTCPGPGFILSGDSSRQCSITGQWTGTQPSCDNINECNSMNGMCQQLCRDTDGSYDCHCRDGYVQSPDNFFSCVDKNECEDGMNGGCDHQCHNYVGGFNCSCDDGYLLSQNGRECIDINECQLNDDNCHPDATCSNVGGGFDCFCNIGFEGNGTSCINTDECAQSGDPCQENSECTDTDGGFVCQCLTGFEDVESICINVNECKDDNICHEDATCRDTNGSYSCTCNEGTAGDGITCEAQCVTNFQLVLGPVDSCLNWRFGATTAKLSDITIATVSMINSVCDCNLPPDHVTQEQFNCFYDEDREVIYRAKLRGVEASDCMNLTRHIQEWVWAESSILIQGNSLTLNSRCEVVIDNLGVKSDCKTTPTTMSTITPTESPLQLEVIIGGAVAGAIILILLLLLLIFICCICCKRKEKHKTSEPNEYNTLSRPASTHAFSMSGPLTITSATPTGGKRSIFDYTTDIDTKSSTTFEPAHVNRTQSLPMVHKAEIKRESKISTRSESFSSVDSADITYANVSDQIGRQQFDDPVYELIKGEEKEEFAPNPLYDGMKSTNL